MMDSGKIVLDIGGEEKKNMTVEGLLKKFRSPAGKLLIMTESAVRIISNSRTAIIERKR